MKTGTLVGYEYTELSEKAKEKVKTWLNDGWYEDNFTVENFQEELKALGYEGIDIQYSGFYSQGDGASIACSVDLIAFLKRNRLSKRYASLLYWLRRGGWTNFLTISRRHWGNYVHHNLLYADSSDILDNLNYENASGKAIDQLEDISKLVLEEVQEKSLELYQQLQAEYEWHFTDEYMTDMCQANGYLFDEYGNPVHHLMEDVEEIELTF